MFFPYLLPNLLFQLKICLTESWEIKFRSLKNYFNYFKETYLKPYFTSWKNHKVSFANGVCRIKNKRWLWVGIFFVVTFGLILIFGKVLYIWSTLIYWDVDLLLSLGWNEQYVKIFNGDSYDSQEIHHIYREIRKLLTNLILNLPKIMID